MKSTTLCDSTIVIKFKLPVNNITNNISIIISYINYYDIVN